MSAPKRIQMSRQQPWRAENPDAVIVSRPTAYGNKFAVGGWYVIVDGRAQPTSFPQFHEDAIRIPDAAAAVALFRQDLEHEPAFVVTIRNLLAGYDLACWCPLDESCHADGLLELANA